MSATDAMTDDAPFETAPGSKSRTAMKTISEVAEILELPTHVLRFWETKFPQIQPLKRAGGRRFYRAEDIDALLLIKDLLHGRGFTIKGATKVLPDLLKARRAGEALPAVEDEFALFSHDLPARFEPILPAEPAPASQRQALLALRQQLESLRGLLD